MRRLSLFATISLASLAGCADRAEPDRPNVILVTLDTVRADRLGCYGYARRTTPRLDAFAAEAVRFDNAFAQSSFTPPSHASILTSRYPSSHGVLWWNKRMPDEVVTLAEAYLENGYRTAMFSPLRNWGADQNNIAQGFQHIVQIGDDPRHYTPIPGTDPYRIASGAVINERVDEWLSTREGGPFFAWIHYYDAHRPYSIFAPDRAFCAVKDGALGNHTGFDYQLKPETRRERKLGAPHAQYLKDRYDSGLLGLDREIGKLLDRLERDDLLDKSIVVFVADHGEAFDEFDEEWFTHDPFLYDVVTHVPLLIRFPDGRYAGRAIDGLVETVDIAPTLLDFCGLQKAPGMQGSSLRSLLDGGEPDPFVFSERQGRDRGPDGEPIDPQFRRSIRSATMRLIAEDGDDTVRLFDRTAEPNETTDVFDPEDETHRGIRETYRAFVDKIDRLRPDLDFLTIDPETRALMEQLGYI